VQHLRIRISSTVMNRQKDSADSYKFWSSILMENMCIWKEWILEEILKTLYGFSEGWN